MGAHLVAMSDLHLGYDRSVWSDPQSFDRVAGEVTNLCGGGTKCLVLNGDAFEACVPARVGERDAAGFPAATAEASRSFFAALTSRVRIDKLVLVWGNHDFCLQERVEDGTSPSPGRFLSLNHGSIVAAKTRDFLSDFLGPSGGAIGEVQTAYPNFCLSPLGSSGPLVVFHHGHLLDPLVLGWDPEVDYLALNLLVGCGRPQVSREDTAWAAACETWRFVARLWEFNSRTRAEEWAVLRRLESRHSCGYYPGVPGAVSSLVGPEAQGPGLGRQVPWYLTASAPGFPNPVGPDPVGYFVVGHDHDGGDVDVGLVAGRRWRLLNLGGWTTDRDEDRLHSHVAVWLEGETSPELHCVRV